MRPIEQVDLIRGKDVKVGSYSQLTVEQLIYNLTYLMQTSPEEDWEKLIADFCHKHIKNN